MTRGPQAAVAMQGGLGYASRDLRQAGIAA
jgi:hypothetical protein